MKPCKHKFEPRYDEIFSTIASEAIHSGTAIKINGGEEPYLKAKTYIHDICVKCGDIKTRERED